MRFVHCEDTKLGVDEIVAQLVRELTAGKKVLWLVCGGSNIAAEVAVMDAIPAELSENLTVTLTDERYGEVGHKDSNWQQLTDAGFDIKSGSGVPVLNGGVLERTIEDYDRLAQELFEEAEVIVAVFGVGADGHIAGILPGSPASRQTTKLAAGYNSPPYTRLTLTFPALQRIDTAYALAFGNSKREVLRRLQSEDIAVADQPSQILKRLPEAVLFSDQIGEDA